MPRTRKYWSLFKIWTVKSAAKIEKGSKTGVWYFLDNWNVNPMFSSWLSLVLTYLSSCVRRTDKGITIRNLPGALFPENHGNTRPLRAKLSNHYSQIIKLFHLSAVNTWFYWYVSIKNVLSIILNLVSFWVRYYCFLIFTFLTPPPVVY